MKLSSRLRTCNKGHHYFKSSDCPVCPVCEQDRKPQTGLLSVLSAPARRALEAKGIKTKKQLAAFNLDEIASWHGIGPKAWSNLKKF